MVYRNGKLIGSREEECWLMLGIKWSKSLEERWSDFENEALPFMPDLYRNAMRLTRKESDAEDLVQETFFQALKSFNRYEVGTNCKAWLMMIMHNLNLKRHRKIRTMALVDDGEETIAETIPFEPSIPEALTEEGIISAMEKIPEQFRQVVILADVEEYSYKEISLIMGIPVGTVMSRIHRGRKLLRIELAEFAKDFNLGQNQRVAGI